MALTDPQSIKIGGTTISLPRTFVEEQMSKYTSEDGLTEMTLSTQNGKRLRQIIRVDCKKVIPSVLTPSQNEEAGASVYTVFDRPMSGFTNTDMLNILVGLNELGGASTNAVWKKLLGRES